MIDAFKVFKLSGQEMSVGDDKHRADVVVGVGSGRKGNSSEMLCD